MRVLVTGAAGFMGSHAVDSLLDLGHEVTAADSLIGGYVENVNPAAEFVECDLADRAAAAQLVASAEPEVIFHYAADATEGRSQFTPLSSMDNNVVAYLNTLVPAIARGLSKVVLVSSMSVYGAQPAPFTESMPRLPEDVYAAMKASMEAATEHLAAVHGFEYAVFRPHSVYGERQNLADPYRNVVAIFINALLRGRAIHIYGDGEQRRAYSYIGDVNPAIVDGGLSDRSSGQIFNVGSSEDVSINQLADVVREVFFEGAPGRLTWSRGTCRPDRLRSRTPTARTPRLNGFWGSATGPRCARVWRPWCGGRARWEHASRRIFPTALRSEATARRLPGASS